MLFEGLLDYAAALQGELPRGAFLTAALALRLLHRWMPGHVLEISDLRPDFVRWRVDFHGLGGFWRVGPCAIASVGTTRSAAATSGPAS